VIVSLESERMRRNAAAKQAQKPGGPQALLLWTLENRTGIEPVKNVPQSARFTGAATTAMFSGDKRWYPAKVIMVSGEYKLCGSFGDNITLQPLLAVSWVVTFVDFAFL